MTRLAVGLIAGPIYDPLYARFKQFTDQTGITIDIVFHGPQHDLNQVLADNYRLCRADRRQVDLASTHGKYAASQQHFLLSLDGLVDQTQLDGYHPAMIEFARVRGDLVQLPRNCDVKLLHYRRDVVDRPPENWAEVIEQAISRTHAERGKYGWTFTGRGSGLFGVFFELLACAGGELLSSSLEPQLNSDAAAWALETLHRLYEQACDRRVTEWSFDDVAKAFAAGTVASYCEWPGYWGILTDPQRSRIADVVDVAAYPAGIHGRAVYTGSHSFALTTDCQELDAGLTLLRWLTADEQLLLEARSGSLVPKLSVYNRVLAETTSARDQNRWRLLWDTMAQDTLLPPRSPLWPAMEDALWPVVRKGYTGQLRTDEALRTAASAMRRAAAEEDFPLDPL